MTRAVVARFGNHAAVYVEHDTAGGIARLGISGGDASIDIAVDKYAVIAIADALRMAASHEPYTPVVVTRTSFAIGDRVAYTAHDGAKPEPGTIDGFAEMGARLKPVYAFVLFDRDAGGTAKATPIDRLTGWPYATPILPEPMHLGDGAYISAGAGDVLITAGNHDPVSATDSVYLDIGAVRLAATWMRGWLEAMEATSRKCRECGCLVAGGPTLCKGCTWDYRP